MKKRGNMDKAFGRRLIKTEYSCCKIRVISLRRRRRRIFQSSVCIFVIRPSFTLSLTTPAVLENLSQKVFLADDNDRLGVFTYILRISPSVPHPTYFSSGFTFFTMYFCAKEGRMLKSVAINPVGLQSIPREWLIK